MLHQRARWNVNDINEETADRLAGELGIQPLIARLLAVRGFHDTEQTKTFLYGGTEHIHDPFLFDGMKEAVERIRLAIERGERIRIYGDYDADGVSSTSLMIRLFRQFDCSFDYYIPHRVHEGYGLNRKALDHAKRNGVSLLVTVDTGISAREEIAYASEIGIDVIVTDHHEPPEWLPEAVAIINPKKPGCPYPYKYLAGVGVALKLAQALLGHWPDELIEIASIGTVADLMPLTGENRVIVRQGLKVMRSTSNHGIRALLGAAGVECKDVSETHIGFSLAPRINASGRLHSADDAVRLLTTDVLQEAEHLAHDLDTLNKERQRLVDDMTKHAFAMIEENMTTEQLPSVIVLAHETWNVGVIGIVASKVLDKFYRPTIILGIDSETGLAKGSARSIAGFDVYRALTHCGDLMEHYGGHQAAAGMTIHKDHLHELSKRLNRLADEWLTEQDFVPLLQADIVCGLSEISVDSIRQLDLLAPFGMGNPSPRFLFNGLTVRELRSIGKERQHIKLVLAQAATEAGTGTEAVDAVGFGKGESLEFISASSHLDVLGELSINEWNGTRKPQIMIKDLRVGHVQLFDWRGANLSARMGELARRMAAGQRMDVVLFGEADSLPWKTAAANCAVWVVTHVGRVLPGNELAKMSRLSEATDVILGSLPGTLSELDTAIGAAAGAERFYAAFADGGSKESATMPSRDMFKLVYTSLLRGEAGSQERFSAMLRGLSKRSGLSEKLIRFMIEVFEELGFVEGKQGGFIPIPSPAKKELSESIKYKRRSSLAEIERHLVYTSGKEIAEWFFARHAEAQKRTEKDVLEGIV
ncbi:single-stranded-DNA-specific exonuclease RecJ [Paenibacillus thalictri]|uniref:Single-stranded-DNA-specific exonuclease RecJ n=1 Tax=Paenibacillus thalictri TaxID=2527873 RepID=A0A4Q9DWW5_9BACL|nr:single-stranded-DNA-specific exonuclease RecJ [Paenibacillus thalictri]TBL81594.1 single-stranded-DNA-specific exonuclease RecJ [Paenibacillus thalictri]